MSGTKSRPDARQYKTSGRSTSTASKKRSPEDSNTRYWVRPSRSPGLHSSTWRLSNSRPSSLQQREAALPCREGGPPQAPSPRPKGNDLDVVT
eukprot:11784035-Heterocapsa_arctica.AAC.1